LVNDTALIKFDKSRVSSSGGIWTSLNILFPANGVVGYRQTISSRLYVLSKKDLVHSMAEHFQIPVNKLKKLNFNPIPKNIAGRLSYRATWGPRVWDPWTKGWSRKGSL